MLRFIGAVVDTSACLTPAFCLGRWRLGARLGGGSQRAQHAHTNQGLAGTVGAHAGVGQAATCVVLVIAIISCIVVVLGVAVVRLVSVVAITVVWIWLHAHLDAIHAHAARSRGHIGVAGPVTPTITGCSAIVGGCGGGFLQDAFAGLGVYRRGGGMGSQLLPTTSHQVATMVRCCIVTG